MIKKYTNSPIGLRIGILLLVFSIIIYLIGTKLNSGDYLLNISGILFFLGFFIMGSGLSKIKIGEDGGGDYQFFIQRQSKFLMLGVALLMLLGIIGLFLNKISFLYFFLGVTIVFLIIMGILQWIFYKKTYEFVKKVNKQRPIHLDKKEIIIFATCILLGLLFWCFIGRQM